MVSTCSGPCLPEQLVYCLANSVDKQGGLCTFIFSQFQKACSLHPPGTRPSLVICLENRPQQTHQVGLPGWEIWVYSVIARLGPLRQILGEPWILKNLIQADAYLDVWLKHPPEEACETRGKDGSLGEAVVRTASITGQMSCNCLYC